VDMVEVMSIVFSVLYVSLEFFIRREKVSSNLQEQRISQLFWFYSSNPMGEESWTNR